MERKTAPRKTVNTPEPISNFDQMMDKLSTQKRVISPNFSFFKGRYRKGQQLPSFMENLNNRLAITGLSYEMIKANGYSESDWELPITNVDSKMLIERLSQKKLDRKSVV